MAISQEGFQSSGRTPLRVYNKQPTYNTYISPYGPKYVFLCPFYTKRIDLPIHVLSAAPAPTAAPTTITREICKFMD